MKSIAEFTNAFESMESAGAEQARRADYNHEWALRAERERDTERTLADRLAEAIQKYLVLDENIDATTDELNDSWEHLQSSLAAWKEARHADMLSNLADTPTDQRIVKYSKAMLK
jgi:hypothetical protein